jgi:hypothetical protein
MPCQQNVEKRTFQINEVQTNRSKEPWTDYEETMRNLNRSTKGSTPCQSDNNDGTDILR